MRVKTRISVFLGLMCVSGFVVFLAASSPSHGNPVAPPDNTFKHAEPKLYMERHAGSGADTVTVEAQFIPDPGYTIDTDYHQPAPVKFAGGDRDSASSPLTVNDIPPGVFLQPGGGWYWSIQGPLKLYVNVNDFGPDGKPKAYTFSARLYCGPEPSGGPGCNANMDVWVKQKRIAKKVGH
jgi:hypothetical protein